MAFENIKKSEEDLKSEVSLEQQIRNQMMAILIETQDKINQCIKQSALRARPLPASKLLQIEYNTNDSSVKHVCNCQTNSFRVSFLLLWRVQ